MNEEKKEETDQYMDKVIKPYKKLPFDLFMKPTAANNACRCMIHFIISQSDARINQNKQMFEIIYWYINIDLLL